MKPSPGLEINGILKNIFSTLLALFLIQTGIYGQQCSVDSTFFNWDTIDWVPGSFENTYRLPLEDGVEDVDVTMSVSDNMAGSFVGSVPAIDSGPMQVMGSSADLRISFNPDPDTMHTPIIINLIFSTPVRCVAFDISDIDARDDGTAFKDSVIVFGREGDGLPVVPELSFITDDNTFRIDSGTAVALGGDAGPDFDGTAAGGSDNGTVRVKFKGALIDAVTIIFLDHSESPDPGTRSIGLFGNLTFSQMTLLPVELLSYSVERDADCQPLIKWQTAQEYDLEYYAIEYSYDGINFSNAAFIRPRNTYHGVNNYQYLMERKLNAENYFRLVKRELDGSEEILALEALDGKVCYGLNDINVYPNPSHKDYFYVEIDASETQSSEITIVDQVGKIISRSRYGLRAGQNWFKVNSKYFRPGTYFVQITAGDDIVTRKVSIIN